MFLGQSVYYWHNDPRTKRPTWKGPALIAGTWGTGKVLIAHGNSFVTISNENIHTTNKVLGLIGSDSSLQLHTMGTSIPLFQVVDTKQLVFLMRYRDNLVRQIKPTIATLDLQNLDPLKELEDPDFKSKVNFDLGGEFEFDVFLETMRGAERERLSEAQIKAIGDISAKLEEQVKFHLRKTLDTRNFVEWKMKSVTDLMEFGAESSSAQGSKNQVQKQPPPGFKKYRAQF